MRCALDASLAIELEAAALAVAEGRHDAARSILPNNPVLAGSVSSRVGPTDRAVNWSVSLSQEIEIAGQRGSRIEAAQAELREGAHRLSAVKAAIAEEAWSAYFSSGAAQLRLALAARLASVNEAVARRAQQMASAELLSDVDVDLARAAALRASGLRLKAAARSTQARSRLARLVCPRCERTPSIDVDLDPPHVVLDRREVRPELLAATEAEAAQSQRVDLVRSRRVPNPSVTLLAQNDGFNEQVLGVGLSVPVPLPQPLGHTLRGELAEAVAVRAKARIEAESLGRVARTELLAAEAEYHTSLATLELYTSEAVGRANARLEAIATQVEAGRLPIRDGLVSQQALVELLEGEIAARESLCLAAVRLARAAGLSLEGDTR